MKQTIIQINFLVLAFVGILAHVSVFAQPSSSVAVGVSAFAKSSVAAGDGYEAVTERIDRAFKGAQTLEIKIERGSAFQLREDMDLESAFELDSRDPPLQGYEFFLPSRFLKIERGNTLYVEGFDFEQNEALVRLNRGHPVEYFWIPISQLIDQASSER